MFKLEYTLHRGNNIYHESYPGPDKEDYNIFIFRGRNGLGKSTVMQILALGMFGLHSNELSPEIKSKVNRLVNEDTKEFSFSLDISSFDKDIEIRSSLKAKNDNLRVMVNDSYYDKTAFSDKFQLIFDVPDEITKKLNSSLIVIKNELANYIDYTLRYRQHIQREYENINAYEKKTQRLNELNKDLLSEEGELDNLRQRLESVEEDYAKQRKLYVVKKYNEWHYKIGSLSYQIGEIKKRVDPKIQKSKQTKFSISRQNFVEFLNELKTKINELGKSIEEVDILKNSNELKGLITSIKKCNGPDDFHEQLFNKFMPHLFTLSQMLANDPRNGPTEDDKELELVNDVIDILKKYVKFNPEIPGTNGKSLNQFLADLDKRRYLLSEKLKEIRRFRNTVMGINTLKEDLGTLKTKWKNISSHQQDSEEDINQLKKTLEKYLKDTEELGKKLSEISTEYNCLSETERNIDYDLIEEKDYESAESERANLKEKIQEVESKKVITESLIKEYGSISLNPPKYTKETLDRLNEITERIEVKLRNWLDLFNKNMNGVSIVNKSNITSSDATFYDALGKYLANILQFVYHGDRQWKLTKIDLIKENFVVEDGFPIAFNDISTGFTALNSILARVKQKYGGRKKILLFDEIGIMDNRNIKILLNEIKKQVSEGEVIFAGLNLADKELDHVEVDGISER